MAECTSNQVTWLACWQAALLEIHETPGVPVSIRTVATGALGLGWLSTWFLSGTLEDLLALGLAAAVAYVSVVRTT
jgi:hypothetical protein